MTLGFNMALKCVILYAFNNFEHVEIKKMKSDLLPVESNAVTVNIVDCVW